MRDKFGCGCRGKLRRLGRSEAGRSESIEPAAVAAAGEIELGLDVVGDRPGVFDRFAVHVEDGQRAVGGVDEIDGTEPVVARADEFGVFVGTPAFERDAVAGENLPVNQVAGDFADEDVATKLFRIGAAAINADATGAGPIASAD